MCVVAIYGQHVKKGMWGDPESLERLSLATRLVAAAYYLAYYAWRPFYPFHHHTVNEDLVPLDPQSPRLMFAYLLLIGLTIGTLMLRRRRPGALAAWIGFAGLAGPALKLTGEPPFPGPGDRYSILCGLVTAAVLCFWMNAAGTPEGRRRWLTVLGVAGLIFALHSRMQSEVWQDNETFFTDQLANQQAGPTRAKAHCVLGHLAAQSNDLATALDHYDKAWQESAVVAAEHVIDEHAELLLGTGRTAAAISMLENARTMLPDRYRTGLYLGAALITAHRREEGIAVCEDTLRRHPDQPDAFGFYAAILIGRRETALAAQVLQRGLQQHPDHRGLRAMLDSLGSPPGG
jgi:tetratricopeptide (TPR) repeat protein